MPPVDLLAYIAAVAAALAAVRYLGKTLADFVRYVRRVLAKLETLSDLATYELNPNGGASMKDQVSHNARAIANLQEDMTAVQGNVRSLDRKVTAHIAQRQENAS